MSKKIDITARSTRRPRLRVLAYASVLAILGAVFVGAGSAASGPRLSVPVGLNSFLTRIGEQRQTDANDPPTFSRTPSFAWKPVAGATRYEFELSTSKNFRAGNGLVWSSKTLTTPATAIPLSLPWITGAPASLYWHVRALNGGVASEWSAPAPFNMVGDAPTQLPAGPGYVRWTPVDGATGYQVWFVRANKVIGTITNVADEREYYTFHDLPSWTGSVDWRVRAVRRLYGQPMDALPAVSYGPWSPTYHSANPTDVQSGDVTPLEAVSDSDSTNGHAQLHSLMPSFLFGGSGDTNFGLHRVYVFSDQGCVNVVYRGAIVGGPAYAPRTTGPLALPQTVEDLWKASTTFLPNGDEGANTFARDTASVRTTEALTAGGSSGSSTGGSSAEGSTPGAKVDLWDRNWPSGRYYWTAVPVRVEIQDATETSLAGPAPAGVTTIRVAAVDGVSISKDTKIQLGGSLGEPAKVASVDKVDKQVVTLTAPLLYSHSAGSPVTVSGKLVYQETELPQDACSNGRVLDFGKDSAQAVPASSTGLSPSGRLLTATRAATVFYGPPLVTWKVAPAATEYEIQWGRATSPSRPWRPMGHTQTPATSAMLPLTPGTWRYRVRGINESLPGNQEMTWSGLTTVRIAKPTFRVSGG